MNKRLVRLFYKSSEPVEVEPGVYEYSYLATPPVTATKTVSKSATLEANQTININTTPRATYSVIIRDDGNDRIFDFQYVKVGKRYYRIEGLQQNGVRVSFVLGDILTDSETIMDLEASL